MEKRALVEAFLNHFRQLWPPKCYVVPREVNRDSLLALGLTPMERKEEIIHLTPEDYVDGPLSDRSNNQENIWIFGKEVNGEEIYIKLKIFEVGGEWNAKCISFHPAERPLSYPFKRR